jgi:hypothetical protein
MPAAKFVASLSGRDLRFGNDLILEIIRQRVVWEENNVNGIILRYLSRRMGPPYKLSKSILERVYPIMRELITIKEKLFGEEALQGGIEETGHCLEMAQRNEDRCTHQWTKGCST